MREESEVRSSSDRLGEPTALLTEDEKPQAVLSMSKPALPVNHFVAVPVPSDFSAVIVAAADRDGRTYSEQLLAFAVAGADCARIHGRKEQHTRRKRK